MKPLGNDTIIIVKPDEVNDSTDNTTRWDYTSTTDITVTKCAVQPFLLAEKLQEEDTRDRSYARSTLRVWAPITADTLAIRPEDRIQYNSIEYEVFGHIGVWEDFDSVQQHVSFVIQLRDG